MSLRAMFGGKGAGPAAEPPGTVRGEFRIALGAPVDTDAGRTSGWWAGVVSGPGAAPRAVMYEEMFARTDKWPEAGDLVPVRIPLSEPDEFKIVWAEVPTRKEKALQCARELLASMAGDASASARSGA